MNPACSPRVRADLDMGCVDDRRRPAAHVTTRSTRFALVAGWRDIRAQQRGIHRGAASVRIAVRPSGPVDAPRTIAERRVDAHRRGGLRAGAAAESARPPPIAAQEVQQASCRGAEG